MPRSEALSGASIGFDIPEVELEVGDGENKEDAKESDKYQMLGNMNKSAGQIAYVALKQKERFSIK